MLPRRFEDTERALGNAGRADDAIRGTDNDALLSRISAINAGYLSDPYAKLITKISTSAVTRRVPLINLGTHHRTWALDRLVANFLNCRSPNGKVEKKQIVSLGAGSDTRFWRLMEQNQARNVAKYVEIDFDTITSPKARRICTNKTLSSLLFPSSIYSPSSSEQPKPTISQGGSRLDTPLYTLLPLDLRNNLTSNPSEAKMDLLTEQLLPLLDSALPTLFLAECVYCYMQPEESKNIMSWFGQKMRAGGCVGILYEMCGLDDSFGQVMKRNLQARNIQLPGAVFSSPQTQAERFLAAGFDSCKGVSLNTIRRDCVPSEELARISKLEMLDEVEELELLLEHYCIAWGTIGTGLETLKI